MQLIPSVASYLGLQNKVRAALTAEHLELVARVAAGPVARSLVLEEILVELREMRVLTVDGDIVKLGTAVFLEEDIRRVAAIASDLGKSLAEQMIALGSELQSASPEVRNFLGGIIAAAQGPSQLLKQSGHAVDWKAYSGPYASTKVDFDQDCPTFTAVGPELQVKTVLKGERYTAVFIGPGGKTYPRLVNALYPAEYRAYRQHLLRYLTDSYGMLLAGELANQSLRQTAEEVGIFHDGQPRPILVNKELFARYRGVVQQIAATSCQIYAGSLDQIFTCLRGTTSGRQDVAPANMMMHFGRYCRKALARELYAAGFFTDQVPTDGIITVFYDNTIAELNAFLG